MHAIRAFLDKCLSERHHFGPIPAWWWSGEKLEITRLRWQMDQMRAMGIRQFVVINLAPSGTMFCSDADDPPYMSEAWWTIFCQVCEYAQGLGMKVWFYDQIGFSGASYQADIACANPECVALQLKSKSVEGVGNWIIPLPENAEPHTCYLTDAAGKVTYIPFAGRCAMMRAQTHTKLTAVYTVRQGYDFHSRSACERLLDAVHRQFEQRVPEHLGSTIVGSYQDELPDLPTWSQDFERSFHDRFGYPIGARIHHLFEIGGAEARQTRVHYQMHRAALAEEAFFKPFYQWHEKHGLRCGFDQQSPAREARVVGAIEKYADYMQTHKWYACPGSDLHGNGKLHASMAFLHQRPRVWLEGFHSTGWGGTIADTFDWMLPYLRQGVTLYNPHAIYYSTRKGWWEWAPPSTCWRQPYAEHYKPFAEMIERLLSVLSRGTQQADVGVLFPTATVQSAVGVGVTFDEAKQADATLHEVIGSIRWHQVKTGVLDSIPIDYLILDEQSIAEAAGEASITLHGVSIQTLILPSVTMLHEATVRRLIRFGKAGGSIFCVGSATIQTIEGNTVDLRVDANATELGSSDQLRTSLRNMDSPIRADLPTLYRRDGDTHIVFIPASHGMATIVKWDSWFAPLEKGTIDPSRYASSASISLPEHVTTLWKWDPQTDTLRQLHRPANNQLSIDFEGSPFAVLMWDADAAISYEESALTHPRSLEVSLGNEWSCSYKPTLPTQYADIYDPDRCKLRWPRTTVFQWKNHSTGESKPVRATFGPRVRLTTSTGSERSLEYSPWFGIERDALHQHSLGPKGHVPDEFLDLGKLAAGESSTIHFDIQSESPRSIQLVLSANAIKSVVVNGSAVSTAEKSYRSFFTCVICVGINRFELKFLAERAGQVRASWCFVPMDSLEAMRTPERLIAPDPAQLGTTIRFVKRFVCPAPIDSFALKVSTAAVAKVILDRVPIARLGGFDPYRLQPRGMVYHVPLTGGEHEVVVEVQDTGSAVPILVDGLGTDRGGQRLSLLSDASWMVTRDGEREQPAAIQLKQDVDGSAWHLYRRPHPLFQATWPTTRAKQSAVLPLEPEPTLIEPVRQTFEWMIPPGAVSMTMNLSDVHDVLIEIDGKSVNFENGTIMLEGPPSVARAAKLSVSSRRLGGAVFHDMTTYTFSEGSIRIGDFSQQGLNEYSGVIQLHRAFTCDPHPSEKIILDLGEVRGSVEAVINGVSAGIRFISPFTFDVTALLKTGENQIQLLLANTLANHLAHWSPTRCIAGDQLRYGIFGPVRIRYEARHPSLSIR